MIPVNTPLLDGNEKAYLAECIDTGWISSEGPFVKRFEDGFARLCQRDYAIAVSNGTAALELAVNALGIGPGDEVILPTFTIISCAAAITRAGAIPVPVDCDADTWNISVAGIEAAITPKTRAIMVVHMYGLPAEIDRIQDLAEHHGLAVIEDAAHVHGHHYRGRPCGAYGTLSVFSFYPNKILTSGEGGMVLTDDRRLAMRVRSLMNLCFQPEKRFVHEELGWNYRLSNLQAAVGVAQLEQIDRFHAIKRRIGSLYQQHLEKIDSLQLPMAEVCGADNIYWVFGIVLREDSRLTVAELVTELSARGIATRPFFWPIHEQPVFQDMGMFQGMSHPNAERLARRGIYLPSGLGLTQEQQHSVCSALEDLLA